MSDPNVYSNLLLSLKYFFVGLISSKPSKDITEADTIYFICFMSPVEVRFFQAGVTSLVSAGFTSADDLGSSILVLREL